MIIITQHEIKKPLLHVPWWNHSELYDFNYYKIGLLYTLYGIYTHVKRLKDIQ